MATNDISIDRHELSNSYYVILTVLFMPFLLLQLKNIKQLKTNIFHLIMNQAKSKSFQIHQYISLTHLPSVCQLLNSSKKLKELHQSLRQDNREKRKLF